MPIIAGTRLGAYEILAQGGMGEVYRARHQARTRRSHQSSARGGGPRRAASGSFRARGRLLASLNHPNIGAIYSLEQHEGRPVLVLEFVLGPTLAERIASGPIEMHEALTIAAQIATAVEAAHEQTIIHRDLKPANVKITPEGKVKVTDFGLGKAFGEAPPKLLRAARSLPPAASTPPPPARSWEPRRT